MKLEEGQILGEQIKAILAPYCDRIEIAGSIRREKAEVGDIEIVCIPKVDLVGLFEDEEARSAGFVSCVNQWEAIKGKATGKYTQRIYQGQKVDIFMAQERNWGLIFAIRTGSADFSHNTLARRWVAMGYHSEGGILHDEYGYPQLIEEEEDLFQMIGLDWVEPKERR